MNMSLPGHQLKLLQDAVEYGKCVKPTAVNLSSGSFAAARSCSSRSLFGSGKSMLSRFKAFAEWTMCTTALYVAVSMQKCCHHPQAVHCGASALLIRLCQGCNKEGKGDTVPREPKSPNNVASTFFSAVHLFPKDLMSEHGGAKLVSCPGRHLTSVHPWAVQQSLSKMLYRWNFQEAA